MSDMKKKLTCMLDLYLNGEFRPSRNGEFKAFRKVKGLGIERTVLE